MMAKNDTVYIIIPAKNEGTRIHKVLSQVIHFGYNNIIVVNDGSTDDTADIARSHGAIVLDHVINLGAGAATQTGIEFALEMGAEIVVTMDADQQHFPSDIDGLVNTLRNKEADMVIGSRFMKDDNDIPPLRVLYNKIGNVVTYFFTGVAVSDSQSGMKAICAKYAKKSKLSSNGFEFCVEMIKNIKINNASVIERPIQVIYTKETLDKGQNLATGFKMLGKLMRFF